VCLCVSVCVCVHTFMYTLACAYTLGTCHGLDPAPLNVDVVVVGFGSRHCLPGQRLQLRDEPLCVCVCVCVRVCVCVCTPSGTYSHKCMCACACTHSPHIQPYEHSCSHACVRARHARSQPYLPDTHTHTHRGARAVDRGGADACRRAASGILQGREVHGWRRGNACCVLA